MKKFGYDVKYVDILRTAHHWYPDEPQFKSIPIHVKYNRARVGDLKQGSMVKNFKLRNVWTGKREKLILNKKATRTKNGISVILAGSFS